jgi:hypothetical protein
MASLLLAPAMCQLSHVEDRYSRYRLETTEVEMFFLPLQSIREQSIFQGCEEVIGCILPGSHVPTQSRPLKPLTSIHPDSEPSPLFLPFLPTDWPTRKYLNTPSPTPGLHHPRKPLAGDRSPDPRRHSSPISQIPTDSSPTRPPALL